MSDLLDSGKKYHVQIIVDDTIATLYVGIPACMQNRGRESALGL